MAKIAPSAKLGIAKPANLADIVGLVVYVYADAAAVETATPVAEARASLSALEVVTKDGAEYYKFDTANLPALPEGEYDVYAAFIDDANNESNFSPVYDLPLDREPPAAPTAIVRLD